MSQAAAGLVKVSEERDPAMLAQFVQLRVIDPESTYWRRGVDAASRWLRETRSEQLRASYDYKTPEDWPAVGGFPLGVWLADQRLAYNASTLDPARVAELNVLNMVWSHHDVAFDEGLAVARAWASAHGHFLPPATAVWEDFPIGVWAKNQRAAARKTLQNAERRADGRPVPSHAGELPESRLEALEEIDPGWCPAWTSAGNAASASPEPTSRPVAGSPGVAAS
ncbi:helicase associated domain-containing protein [Streptomyces sp. NPDC054775]